MVFFASQRQNYLPQSFVWCKCNMWHKICFKMRYCTDLYLIWFWIYCEKHARELGPYPWNSSTEPGIKDFFDLVNSTWIIIVLAACWNLICNSSRHDSYQSAINLRQIHRAWRQFRVWFTFQVTKFPITWLWQTMTLIESDDFDDSDNSEHSKTWQLLKVMETKTFSNLLGPTKQVKKYKLRNQIGPRYVKNAILKVF